MSVAMLTATANLRDTYVGYWSPYTLLFALFMAFIGLILVVVFLIYALMGRINPRRATPGEAALDEEESETAPSMDMALKRSQKTALRKAREKAEKEEPRRQRRKTGWQYLAGGIGCSVLSFLIFIWVDNPLGRMRGLTFGSVLNFLLLALQVFLTVQFVLCQRQLPR